MGYGKKIFQEAMDQLEARKRAAEEAAWQRQRDFAARCPRAGEIKWEMAQNASQIARAVLGGGDAKSAMAQLRDRDLALQEEYKSLLAKEGLTPQDLEPRYTCPRCRDTGFVDGRMCQCLKQLQRSLAYQALSADLPLEKSTFDTFSLEFYQDDPRARRQMEAVLKLCQRYAERLRPNSPSLLFKGKTGLGKTHLSLAIANKAIEKGMGVVYGSAQSFAVALEKERFDRADPDGPGDTNAQLMGCDLLILDDLGTEFPSQYVNAALYNIVNTRMLAEKPTIISTNLSMKELEDRYSQRFASRIMGYYGTVEFLGSDVRVQLLKKRRDHN